MSSPPPREPVAPEYWRELDDTECVLLAQQYLAAGSLREALDLCRGREAQGVVGRGLRLCEARARFGLGERAEALDLIQRLLDERPRDTLCAFYRSQLLIQSGQAEAARASLCSLIASAPDFPGALPTLAQLVFPGPPYREVLRRLHEGLRPEIYLEIGVEHGTSLQLATHSRVAIGVDPVPRPMPRHLPPHARLFHMTSDDFFAANAREELLGDGHVDLAFIDGMHWFEFALRDFHNAERWCAPGSVLVLHDCLPVAEVAAARQRSTSFWVGDTWKALEYLLEFRRDLEIAIIPCHPSGLVVVQLGASPLPADAAALSRFCADYMERPYPHAAGRWPAHYPIVRNTEQALTAFIAALAERRRRARAEGEHR